MSGCGPGMLAIFSSYKTACVDLCLVDVKFLYRNNSQAPPSSPVPSKVVRESIDVASVMKSGA